MTPEKPLDAKALEAYRDEIEEMGKRLYDSIKGADKDPGVRGGWLLRLWGMVRRSSLLSEVTRLTAALAEKEAEAKASMRKRAGRPGVIIREGMIWWEPCVGCKDGHSSYWKTVVESPQWQAWEKIGHKEGFDVDEAAGCGTIGARHFQAFLKFCSTWKTKKKRARRRRGGA